ncbi:DUF7511 domain-containing protein [Natrarchaeobaculum sulfurireducens]|uniref:DUF7511 domain-containing protein n=1 Tax=Natrarchaeobaculum sulfurireducens TaxID=2044521 RepID=A0A346PN55_9EURY|nr:hypothetical protein [Natrarchaeobaculum sulfurireducens]AXR79151.1 hypothetical protein AArc1_2839 [Natrarchaeobaculum sulfurireducens]AXR80950.1 hypothetical protein AArcMg_0929 [Natrarchaeobaculum sulfurireducens]
MTSNADVTPPVPDALPIELDHVTVENEDAPNECAIFPREASEEQLMTAWISAHDDSFVALESMR